MNPLWQLPQRVVFGDQTYSLRTDFRNILEIFGYLENPDLPELIRWRIAVGLFYEEKVFRQHLQEAMEYLAFFLRGGAQEAAPGPRLLDWQQDADAIIAGVNRAAGQEIRSLPYVHWWTFLSWFHAIEGGQLSTIVLIRDKLRRGKKLEDWEKEFYRENRSRVDLKPRLTSRELEEKERLQAMLGN